MASPELKASSDEEIRAKLEYANPLILRALVFQATGDTALRDDIRVKKERFGWIEVPVVADERSGNLVKDKAAELLRDYRDGRCSPPDHSTKERIREAMSLAVDEEVPRHEVDYWAEELALDPMVRRLKWKKKPEPGKLDDFHVIVIGAGIGGINAAVQLKTAGFRFTVFEKNPAVGGVWFQNRYPGARVDSPSRMYSNTFAIKYLFNHFFAPQAENEAFFNWCVDQNGIRQSIHFNSEVLSAHWVEDRQQWEVTIRGADGSRTIHHANAIISAVGFLDRPNIPELSGADSFAGAQMHTARFDPSLDWSTKRVGVVGTGASGMQIVPDLAPMVKHLTVFQRSPGWVLPTPGYRDAYPEDMVWLERNIPFYSNWLRFSLVWAVGDHTFYKVLQRDPDWKDPDSINPIHHSIRKILMEYLKENTKDQPGLYEKLLPDYLPFAKRFVCDNGWFDALKRDYVELVSGSIHHIEPDGIVMQSGEKHALDVIIYATGFKANDYLWPMEIRGRDGVTLQDVWARDGARAYWGITIPRMPNLFCIYGPNTNPPGTGPVQWGEMQVRYMLQCFEEVIRSGCGSLEVRYPVFDAFNRKLDEALDRTVFLQNGAEAKSYYTNEFGRSAVNAPWPVITYWKNLFHPNFDDYIKGTPSREETMTQAARHDATGGPRRGGHRVKNGKTSRHVAK